MVPPEQPIVVSVAGYKLGFWALIAIVYALLCMSVGFTVGSLTNRPSLRIENYNSSGDLFDGISSGLEQPLAVPSISIPKRHAKKTASR
jgi:hypothetical protein